MPESALDKVLRLTGSPAAPVEIDPATELLLSAQAAVSELAVLLASDPDDDGDDDSSDAGDTDGDSGHGDHATYKALVKKNVPPKRAAAMCARADKKVKASQLAEDAANMVALAAKAMGDGGVPMHHGPFTGTHTHSHHLTAAHAHPHQHFGDNNHDGGPQHRPGSKPGQGSFGAY